MFVHIKNNFFHIFLKKGRKVKNPIKIKKDIFVHYTKKAFIKQIFSKGLIRKFKEWAYFTQTPREFTKCEENEENWKKIKTTQKIFSELLFLRKFLESEFCTSPTNIS